jgi:predicted  nucleic acid-binding Zn-ribbon protein
LEHFARVSAARAGRAAVRAPPAAPRSPAASALAAAETAVGDELAAATGQRDEIVAAVPAEQLQTYDRLRPDFAGIPIARLVGSNCNGCHLTLSAVALDRIHALPPDALATCEECGRILVR